MPIVSHPRPQPRSARFRKLLAPVLIVLGVAVVLFAVRLNEIAPSVVHFFAGNVIDPATLHLEGEFVESNLGSALESDGSVTVRMIAQQYVFVPRCVLVPAGAAVHLRITSADATHMLTVDNNDVALTVGPGGISHADVHFPTPGRYDMPCHHYCGTGHYAMRGQLVVVPKEQFPQLRPDERVNCANR